MDDQAVSANLWERIRRGFGMDELDSPLVERYEAWYAGRPEYVSRMVERSQRYLFHVVEAIEARGMPMEIALLPVVESAYNPQAYSRSHASGIWQFIPSTGKKYGLEQNWWYDGRRDILAATNAALDYLQKLHDQFGSWELAFAAYNCGEGAIARAIARNQAKGLPTDYLNLKLLRETRNYVPKLIAVKHIVTDPEAYGLSLDSIPNQPYFATVTASEHMDVALAAQLAEMPLDEFVALNPGHNRPVITTTGSTTLLLPIDKIETFNTNLSCSPVLVSWTSYTVKKGESLSQIARRYGVSSALLKQANGIASRKRVKSGQTLLVPLKEEEEDNDLLLAGYNPVPERDSAPKNKSKHTVKRGDTLFALARYYGTTIAQLKTWNGLKSSRLKPGQRLVVRAPAATQPGKLAQKEKTGGKAVHYTVKRGDTLYSIAKRYRVAVDEIQRWNKFSPSRTLFPGEKVTVYPNS